MLVYIYGHEQIFVTYVKGEKQTLEQAHSINFYKKFYQMCPGNNVCKEADQNCGGNVSNLVSSNFSVF